MLLLDDFQARQHILHMKRYCSYVSWQYVQFKSAEQVEHLLGQLGRQQ